MKTHEFSIKRNWSGDKSRHKIQAPTMEDAVYKLVRRTHTFLTDDNHTWEAGKRSVYWAGKKIEYYCVDIIRNKNSTPPAIKNYIFGYGDEVGDTWFAVEYWPVKKRKKKKLTNKK